MATLNGTKVLVIGGASGVGFAVAAAALEAGAEVVVGSSQMPRFEVAAERLGPGAEGRAVDVRDEASVRPFFDAAERFDHLVFTAGDWGHMTASELQDLVVRTLTCAGGTQRRWRIVVGPVCLHDLTTHPHSNWSVDPSGTSREVTEVERLLDQVRLDHSIVSAG